MELIISCEGNTLEELEFSSLKELKDYLIKNTKELFGWIQDNEPDRDLPDFTECETLQDIKCILQEYDYSWWTVEVN